ncbi:MAG: AGE family epimerase/isomerase [Clostridiales bacterium]|nr:AGE family epimerase/isomerase [Clostridiales bacterium]
MAITPEIKIHLVHDLIPFWLGLKDERYGGFYGSVGSDRKVDMWADKGCVLNSRILWVMSSCYKLCMDGALSETKLQDAGYSSVEILEAARHAYYFFRDHYVDMEYGGIYWSVTYDGKPADTTKHAYNHAFAIYALCEFYEVTHDNDAFKLAYYLKNCVENMFTDEIGYLESFGRDFTPDDNPHLSENGVTAYRTVNTLLHIMEAYAELYRINIETNDRFVKRKIYNILDIFENKVYNPDLGRLEVFFNKDYRSLIDLRSYGHDIEFSWQIDRICKVLGDKKLSARMQPVSLALAENTLQYGFDGRSLAYETDTGITKQTRAWWVQAESVIGFTNAYMKTDDKRFKAAARANWDFIKKYIIDKARPSEWYNEVSQEGVPDLSLPMVGEWKCPYHNIRMCIEIIRRNEKFKEEI